MASLSKPKRVCAAAPALAAAIAAALLAAGCTTSGEFPSLAPRAIEQEDPLAEPVRTPPVVARDPAITARAAELLGQARRGEAEFAAAVAAATAVAGRAGAPGSDSWVEGQQALSRAEAARAPATLALAELDRFLVERAALPTADDDLAAIRAALAEAERLTEAQQTRIDAARRLLSR
jgi:hypothetical protein